MYDLPVVVANFQTADDHFGLSLISFNMEAAESNEIFIGLKFTIHHE